MMTTAAPIEQAAPPLVALQPEWERLQHLGYCLSQTRQGRDIPQAEVARLETLQHQVEQLRAPGGVWEKVLKLRLAPMEWDLLVCAVAPDLEPRVGWLFQNLQAGSGHPYPSRALIQDLLALEPYQAPALQQALDAAAPLVAQRLLKAPPEDPYRPLRPEPWIAAALRGHGFAPPPPPGAVRVNSQATWEDLVLPPSRLAQLREFILWLDYRSTVVTEWGGRTTGGPLALFNGPSGTGKTMAAGVIANALGWPLYRVDLGRLVSKYIGETEQNLNKLFDAAHNQPMVLQFDEADALFAKRGEVKEARDRYANMEVSHLLARIESHQGPCILTTNLRKQMDSAFTRRFQVVVEFPRPDVSGRAALWERLLPPRAPRTPGVDSQLLARAVNLTGGSIHNAALYAAYLAAGEGAAIDLRHIAQAVWRELAKEGRELDLSELGSLAQALPAEVLHD